ncbi:MAG: glycerol-3-phosphate 1-O-acyltransferase PlsY [Candidatus Omnitrophica bacterium]|nr:glycerol-3-phosphate 1-O-acyltransferase PlsY [Candidatus Omnitrophota bacterium]
MDIIITIFGAMISYLLGAVPAAFLVGKLLKGIDIRQEGSGNVGATNALRVLGKGPGIVVLCFDIAKGVIAVTVFAIIFNRLDGVASEFIKSCYGLAVVCGHIYNVFLGFKGGKGVATSAGVLLGIVPGAILIGVAVFLLILFLTKYVSLGSIFASILAPFYLLISRAHYSYVLMSAVFCVLIVSKHRENIKRLLSGREKRIFEKK